MIFYLPACDCFPILAKLKLQTSLKPKYQITSVLMHGNNYRLLSANNTNNFLIIKLFEGSLSQRATSFPSEPGRKLSRRVEDVGRSLLA